MYENGIRFHQDIDMRNIKDSMQLDSEQIIASLEAGEKRATLEVRGDVKVWWNPYVGDPDYPSPYDGEYYTYPSEFPEELKDLIKTENYWETDERVGVSENNWFELFIYRDKEDRCPMATVVDVEGYNGAQIFEMMLDALEETE